ncbi:MAG: hypothetical protein ABSC56_04320 [Solirubrobacteraceae bacterium]
MDGERSERLARNESTFRDINERIESGRLPAEASKELAFCCECAQLGCNQLIEVSIGAYERVRANPRRFLLEHGHEMAGVEKVVDTQPKYVVVEKTGHAGEVAEEADPRG